MNRRDELARHAAQAAHSGIYRNGASDTQVVEGHTRHFEDCPHADCVLVRSPLPASPLHTGAEPELLARVQNYLGNGGFFNPEAMEHDKVRALIIDLAAALSSSRTAPIPCLTCSGRGWVMRYETHDIGAGLRSGGAWNEPCPVCHPPASRTAPEGPDEELIPHPFTSRTPREPGDDRDIWCKDCEYHRDHAIHSSVSTTPNGTPASDAIGQPTTDAPGDSIRAPESSSS